MFVFRWVTLFAAFVFAFVVLTAADVYGGSLTLQWDPATDGQTVGYVVLYGTKPGVYSLHVDVGAATSHRVDDLEPGTEYYFSVRAYNDGGELSSLADEVSGTSPGSGGDTPPPSPPPPNPPNGRLSSVTVTLDQFGFVEVSWDAAGGAAVGYRVEVGAAPGQTAYSAFTTDLHIAFDLTGLPAPAYFIRVRRVTNTSVLPLSEEVKIDGTGNRRQIEPRPAENGAQCVTPPRAPRQFTARAVGSAVHLTWQPGVGETPTGYWLQVGSAVGLWNQTAHLPATTELVAMTGSGTYALRLVAVNDCGASLWGAETVLRVTSEAPVPGRPSTLTPQLSGDSLTLSWDLPSTGATPTRYLIEATTPFGPFAYDTGDPSTVFANRNTPPGRYVVTVRAGNASGFGPPSAPVTVIVP